MKLKIKIALAVIFVMLMPLAFLGCDACSSEVVGGTPIDGTFDSIQVFNSGTLIWESEGRVTVQVTETYIWNPNTDGRTWITYEIYCHMTSEMFIIVDSYVTTIIVRLETIIIS
ncbi:MAG: hypothetical protein FWE03_01055 [Firmicutes bacterium]|nr:hypothetical protein [Bacillota bacterium]